MLHTDTLFEYFNSISSLSTQQSFAESLETGIQISKGTLQDIFESVFFIAGLSAELKSVRNLAICLH